MANFSFSLCNGSTYIANTMLETKTGFFVDPINNNSLTLEAWEKYRNEREEEAFRNQPPELFKFFVVNFEDEHGRSYTQLVGAESQEKALALVEKVEKPENLEIVETYEKHCNFAALTIDEAAAQCYGMFA